MVVSNEAGSFFYKERHVWTVYRGERLSQILFERKGWLYTGYTYRDASKPSRREAREREKIRRKRGEGKRRKRLWECRSHPYIFSIFSWPYLLLWVPTTSLPLGSLKTRMSPVFSPHSLILTPPPLIPPPWPNGRQGLVLPTTRFSFVGEDCVTSQKYGLGFCLKLWAPLPSLLLQLSFT